MPPPRGRGGARGGLSASGGSNQGAGVSQGGPGQSFLRSSGGSRGRGQGAGGGASENAVQTPTQTQTLIDGLRSSQTVQTYLGQRGSDGDSVDSDDDLCPICM